MQRAASKRILPVRCLNQHNQALVDLGPEFIHTVVDLLAAARAFELEVPGATAGAADNKTLFRRQRAAQQIGRVSLRRAGRRWAVDVPGANLVV